MSAVKTTRSLGMTLLGAWLILTGIVPFLSLSIPYRSTLVPLVALAAGILLLLGK